MSGTPFSSIALVILASFIGSFGAVFLKMGSAHLAGGLRYIFNWQLAIGIALYLGSSVPFIMALKHGELSVLYPMVSAQYVGTLIWSKWFFGEPITRAKVGAIGLILAGLVCISAGGRA
jgi:multidrug transporter EmrE-like cation transporter